MCFIAPENVCIEERPAHEQKLCDSQLQPNASLFSLGAPSGYGHTLPGKGAFYQREQVCVWYINFAGKNLRSVSLSKLIFKHKHKRRLNLSLHVWAAFLSWEKTFFFSRTNFFSSPSSFFSFRWEKTFLNLRPYFLHWICCRWNEWRACREIKHIGVCSIQKAVLRVNISRFLWNLFVYIGKCWPCLFGSREISVPFLTLVSFRVVGSLDVGPYLLGMGGCQHGKSQEIHRQSWGHSWCGT